MEEKNKYEKFGLPNMDSEGNCIFRPQFDKNTISRDICALHNTDGGTIIIGCNDYGVLVGVTPEDLEYILNGLTYLAQVLSIDVTPVQLRVDDKRVIRLDVPKGDNMLVSVDGKYYIRVADRNSLITNEQLIERLKAGNKKPLPKIKCFVAMSFRFEENPHLEDYYDAIVRAIEKSNLEIELVRVDRSTQDKDVVAQIKDGIKNAHIVIADFTESSHNVYYETGFANACGKHTIYLAERGTKIHFDLEHMNFQFYRNAHELEEVLHDPIVNAFNSVVNKA